MLFIIMSFIATFFVSNAIDLGIDILLERIELTAETKATLKRLGDDVTIVAVLTSPAALIEKNQNPKTDIDVRTEKVHLGWEKTGGEQFIRRLEEGPCQTDLSPHLS